MILAIAVLLVGATATATVLAARNATDRARAATKSITHPMRTTVPTKAPKPSKTPTTVAGVPGLPALPSGWPNLPGEGTTITVTYEVTGDGPAEILYAGRLGKNPVRIRNVKLPWKFTTKMDGTALVLVTAVRVGPEPGSIGCRVKVDGRQVAKSTHEGSFVSVTCSKLVIPQ